MPSIPYTWAEVRIPPGHFSGTPVLAAPPEWCLPFAPMRPLSHRGPTNTVHPDGPGQVYVAAAPVLICDAWGRLPAATDRDRFGQALPPLPQGDLSADFPRWRESLQENPYRYVTEDISFLVRIIVSDSKKDMLPKQGIFLDECPMWHAGIRDGLRHAVPPSALDRALDSWDPRYDPPRRGWVRSPERGSAYGVAA